MRIDLHIHTSPRSACSYIDPLELIQEAQRLKLYGICLTEHQVLWDIGDVDKLAREGGIKIFRGNEFTTNQGDILVFGQSGGYPGFWILQRHQGTADDSAAE